MYMTSFREYQLRKYLAAIAKVIRNIAPNIKFLIVLHYIIILQF
jgi:hypothetical protein